MLESARPVPVAPARKPGVDGQPAGSAGPPAGHHEPAAQVRPPLVERIAGWSARHRAAAMLGWLGFLVAAFVAGQFVGGASVPQYGPGQAGQADRVLHRLNVTSAPAESVLIQGRGRAGAGDPQVRQAVRQVVAALDRLPRAAQDIRSPLAPGGGALISADHSAALVTFKVAGPHTRADATVVTDLAAVARVQSRFPHLMVREAGGASTDRAGNAMLAQDFSRAELTSVPITLVLLLVVFGALIAAAIPVLLAGSAVAAAIWLLAVVGHWLPVDAGTSEIVLVIGMAVGVDYSLFYLRREREERAAGRTLPEAIRLAAATSGRAVVISGLTVMISLAGLFLTGIDAFTGISFGTIMVIGVAVLGSLTVLPAMLTWLGPWTERIRIPVFGHRRTAARQSRLWIALVARVARRPAVWGGIGALAMLALAAPALGMRLGNPAINLPASMPTVRVLDAIAQDFPGRPAPAEVVVSGSHLTGPSMRQAVAALRARASSDGAIREPITATAAAGGRALIIQVPLAGHGTDAASNAALLDLRQQVLPATIGRVGGATYAVTGDTASSYDFKAMLHARTPIVFTVVAVLAVAVLLIAFGSLVIPVISVGLNLLSVGAACGLVTFIFQDGHLQGLLGFTSYGGIIPWVPLFMFVLLFGLSMDYHVFVLSRIHELRLRGASTPDAVIRGIACGAGVVTSAAVIMAAVFSIFGTLSMIELKMLGVGLASAVLIDATVVRGILLPACMIALGDRSWYLPRWLSWLPSARISSAAARVARGPDVAHLGAVPRVVADDDAARKLLLPG
jgi:RND superfamily putative drug exporter